MNLVWIRGTVIFIFYKHADDFTLTKISFQSICEISLLFLWKFSPAARNGLSTHITLLTSILPFVKLSGHRKVRICLLATGEEIIEVNGPIDAKTSFRPLECESTFADKLDFITCHDILLLRQNIGMLNFWFSTNRFLEKIGIVNCLWNLGFESVTLVF